MSNHNYFKIMGIGMVAGWLVVFAAVPNLMVLAASLLTRDETRLISPFFTVENYRRFFNPVYFSVFAQSFKLALTTTALCLLFGYPFAYLVARGGWLNKNLLLLLVIIPFWTSSLVRTYALMILLKANGLVNTALIQLGLIDGPLQLMYTDAAMLLGLTYSLLPFMILPVYASIEKLDGRLLEAARDLGAGPATTFWRITLPLTLPGIIAGVMLTFLPALGMFYIADVLGGARTLLVGNLIRNQFLTARDWPLGSATSIVLNLVMAAMLFIYYRSVKTMSREVDL
jgi:spermidine/putrescine transport system permease protein